MARELPPLEPVPVIELYKRDVDRSLLRENLLLSYEARIQKLQQMSDFAEQLRAAGRPKDFEAISELEALLEEREQDPS